MKLVVGLGNPEERYANTRHNLGFMALDALAKRVKGQAAKGEPSPGLGVSWKYEEKFKSEIFNFTLDAYPFTLVKPQTYMNNSGIAVSLIANFYKVAPEDIIIVYDELDLPLGKIKVRMGGAAAGHHGVESVMAGLGTDQFIRVRLGIGNLKTQGGEHKAQAFSAEKFVIEPFLHSEKAQVKHMMKQATKAIDEILEKGLEYAQNQFN